jgi:clan AA aspartic protease
MIVGVVNSLREAVIALAVHGPNGQVEIDAVVDTGFNGYISLSRALISELGFPFRRRGRAVLADGSEIIFDVYEATVSWDGALRRLEVDEADTDALVGMGLLDGFELTIEAVTGGAVAIELLP